MRIMTTVFLIFLLAVGPAGAQTAGEVLSAVVEIEAEIREDARTGLSLGYERSGNGVVIDDQGLVLTIGYLIMEAERVFVVTPTGEKVPARVLAYDHDSGFGLLRAEGALGVRSMMLGDSGTLDAGDQALAVGEGIVKPVRVVARRPFAGYWEYLLENAVITVPPHPSFGGAALVGADGRLLGIGSIFVNDAIPDDRPVPGNMFVPVEALRPILAELLETGRRSSPQAPWLGLILDETEGRVFIEHVSDGGPAKAAGLKPGDLLIGVGGEPVRGMADFLRKVRKAGRAGDVIPLDVVTIKGAEPDVRRVNVHSRDRHEWLFLEPKG